MQIKRNIVLELFRSEFGQTVSSVVQTWQLSGPQTVESSIAVEEAVENRGLYRVFVSRLFEQGFGHYSATIARWNP